MRAAAGQPSQKFNTVQGSFIIDSEAARKPAFYTLANKVKDRLGSTMADYGYHIESALVTGISAGATVAAASNLYEPAVEVGAKPTELAKGATLPASIGKLDGLASLALSGGESLGGPLPRELADLDKLEHLNVSGTQLVLPTPPGCPPRPTVRRAGFDAKREGRKKVEQLLDALHHVALGAATFEQPKGDLGLRWCGTMVMSAAGHAKKHGVRAGFHAVAVDGAALADAGAQAAVARAVAAGGPVVVDFVGRPPWAWDAGARGATREPEWRLLDPKTGYALEMAKRDGRASVRLRVAGPSKTQARRSYDIEFDLERMIQRNHTATYASSKGPPERRIARFGLGEAPKNLRDLI